jgi:phosphatidylinositol alpha-1,6-mannosyltransferase
VVVSVSRLVPRKGQDRLVHAWGGVLREFPDARLLIVGGGRNRNRLARLARRLDVSARVVFTGPVSDDDLPACFAAGQLFAMPCRSRGGGLDVEAWGTVFLEAAAVGRPSIAGRAGGAPEAVLHEETGLVVDPRSEAAVRSAILRLLRAPDEARRFGERAAARARGEFTWSHLARRLQALLDQAAGGGRPGAAQRDRLSAVTRV